MSVDISDEALLELAAHILEIDNSKADLNDVIEAFSDSYDMSIWNFGIVLEKIIPLMAIEERHDGKRFLGIVVNGNKWIIKQEIE